MARRSGEAWSPLLDLVRTLRGPEGCPWDRAQSTATLAPFLVEEAFEVLHAVESRNGARIAEEAGDLAFVLTLFLRVAEEEGVGSLTATLAATVSKIRERHPHVFADPGPEVPGGSGPTGEGADWRRTLELDWERQKQRAAADPASGSADGDGPAGPTATHRLPAPHPALPALAQAAKIQGKAANLGFDWPAVEPVVAKVREELEELEAARRDGREGEIREELGDLLFAVVNLARFLRLDPESALRSANRKFRDRFHHMLDLLAADGHDPAAADPARLDAYWERAKRAERGS